MGAMSNHAGPAARPLAKVADLILAVSCNHPTRVAIDGVDAAGKTIFADKLADQIKLSNRPVIRASIDGFHHPKSIRYRRGRCSPEGYYYDSFDYKQVASHLLKPLGPGGNCNYRSVAFDYRTDLLAATPSKHARADSVLLFDGIFLHRPELIDYWDFTVYLHVNFEISAERAVERDSEYLGGNENARLQYEQRYVPGQKLYLKACDPMRLADIVINNNDYCHMKIIERKKSND